MYQGLGKIFWIFFKIGGSTFGGGYVMLPLIYRELCEKNQYISEEEMSEMVVLAQAMPGAMAVNCATQVGHKLYGKLGAAVCSLGMVLPSYLIIVFLAGIIMALSGNIYVTNGFTAVRAVVAGMIAAAGWKMFLQIKKNKIQVALTVLSFACAILLDVNPFVFVIAGGIIGYFLSRKDGAQ